jgi:methylglutaconyl-CoA hydratase
VAEAAAAGGPLAQRLAKSAVHGGLERATLPEALALEGELYTQLLPTRDRLEGLAAFAEKRPPQYEGR